MAVTICIYSHRHGEDVWAFDSRASADRLVASGVMADQIEDEVTDADARTKIRALIESGNYAEAIDAYNESQEGNERFEFHDDLNVQSAPPVRARACKCPKCGHDDPEYLQITESYTAYHPIDSLTDTLNVENALSRRCPSENFDDGAGDYGVHCTQCLHAGTPEEFGLPDSSEWDWV